MDLCAKDRVISRGAKNIMDVDEVMSTGVNEVEFMGLEDVNTSIDLEELGFGGGLRVETRPSSFINVLS